MKYLFVIPARAGSKGLPGKNTRSLGGKPLICHTVDAARQISADEHICVSTNDPQVAEVMKARYGIHLPFMRPEELAGDNTGMREVLLHAYNFYSGSGRVYEAIVLLQPTSPLREVEDIRSAIKIYEQEKDVDMAVSVTVAKANPYFTLFEENTHGFLRQSKEGDFMGRQECPPVYQYNGAVYVIRASSLLTRNMNAFERIVKYVMPDERSVDIDTQLDWQIADFLMTVRGEKMRSPQNFNR